jgi:trigger factor
MNIKSNEKKENSTVELVIEVGAAEFDAAINKVYNKQKKNITLPGFRKGKAPRKMIEAMYGAQVFYEDAIEEAYPAAYSAALEEAGIESVAYPKLEIEDVGKEGFTFKATVTVKPEVVVKDYKGMTAPKAEVKVSAADVKAELQTYIDRASRLVTVDRKAKKGDTVVIDFEGFKDGVAFDGGKAENYSLELGSGSFVPGFEDQLIGAKAGEEKDLDITFPEDYAADLAGAAVVFKVKVHEVKERQEPTVDDEFAKDVSEFETLADLKKDLSDKLKERRQEQADREFENALVQKLVDNMEGEIPEAMVDYQADKQIQDYAMRVQSQGFKFEDYLSMMGMSLEDMRAQAKESAARSVRVNLALEAVANAENFEVTDEELEAEVVKLSEEYSMEPDQVRAAVSTEDLKHDLRNRKAVDLIVSTAKAEKPAKKTVAKKSSKKDEQAEETDSAEQTEQVEQVEE